MPVTARTAFRGGRTRAIVARGRTARVIGGERLRCPLLARRNLEAESGQAEIDKWWPIIKGANIRAEEPRFKRSQTISAIGAALLTIRAAGARAIVPKKPGGTRCQ